MVLYASTAKIGVMEHLHFAYSWILYWLFPVLAGAVLVYLLFKRRVRYRYALAGVLAHAGHGVRIPVRQLLFSLRLASLIVLTLLVARPQWVDSSDSVSVKGIDIILTIDVSGSMEWFDDQELSISRIESAKREALDFVDKRTNDPIGLVIFAKEALSRMPLTLDKPLLKSVISEIAVGDIDPYGTALMTGVATAINRLRTSKANSKVIVLLTDGMPEQEELTSDVVIKLAKQFGIKIYTLGVGREDMAYAPSEWGGVVQRESRIDEVLLRSLAVDTGGHFFRVRTPADLKVAYQRIDALEKTKYKTDLFHRYYEAFAWFIWWFVVLLGFELFARFVWWRGIA